MFFYQNWYNQWEFQDPKMEVPTIYKAYIRPKFQGISQQNIALYGTEPPFSDPGIPIDLTAQLSHR